jgi:uncharacterized protein (DUF1697 family)
MHEKAGAHTSRLIKYVAFLRGINVGGHKLIKMEELKRLFESLGFQNVQTVLASGNVLFDARKAAPLALGQKIGKELKTAFGHEVGVIIRTMQEIRNLVDSDPFKNITVTPQTRLYITLLPEKTKSSLKAPYASAEKDVRILKISPGEVLTALTISQDRGTVELMSFLDKEFGKAVTTRSWNTIVKISKKA